MIVTFIVLIKHYIKIRFSNIEQYYFTYQNQLASQTHSIAANYI